MKRIKNFIFSVWSLVTFVLTGPVLVCGYSLYMAILHGYSIERPLYSLLAIAVVAFALYYPMWRAEDMREFDCSHEFESVQRIVFGGTAMAFIALFPEIGQTAEFCYTNPIMGWLFNGWSAFVMGLFALVILVFGLGVGFSRD